MGFFGPYCFKNKRKEKWYIHKYEEENGRRLIYYLSKDSKGAIEIPTGFEVVESPKSGIPVMRKKSLRSKSEESSE
jgi:hypothetical protein